jgi:DNA helicase-2/ATP-dependent DNA helicase PcrA
VVERVRELISQGTAPEDICVLFRAGRDSFDLEAALRAEHLPFVKYGGIRFVELAHVKDVMAHLRVADNPQDFVSWQRILMLLPGIGPQNARQIIAHLIGAESTAGYPGRLATAPQAGRIAELKKLAKLLLDLSEPGQTPEELLQKALAYYEPLCREAYEDYPRRLKDLAELPALASQSQTLADFLADTVLDPPDSAGPVQSGHPLTLSTIHSAKGKEWPHVFIIWLSEGRLPSFPSLEDTQALAEERRLFYVACTRAAQSLTLLAPKEHYNEGAGLKPVELSRYVRELPDALLKQPAAGPVFPVAVAEPPASRGSMAQERPFGVGQMVKHATFGPGKVMGYKGEEKILVNFKKGGLKTLMLRLANLQPA